MLFNLVRPGAGTALVRTAGFGRMLVVLTLLISQMSLAAWKDPLDTPSASTSIAHQTLLLDVVQAGERLVAVGSHGHIIYSDDNGSSWQQGSARGHRRRRSRIGSRHVDARRLGARLLQRFPSCDCFFT